MTVRHTELVDAPDYPTHASGMIGPPEPMLLDTCLIQNIEWVWDRMASPQGGQWTEGQVAQLERRFGPTFANELLSLGYLVDYFQYVGGFPWLVSHSSEAEIRANGRPGAKRVLRGWSRLADATDDWAPSSFRGVAPGILRPVGEVRINPLILRGLGVLSIAEIVADGGPLHVLRDAGDRALVRDALLAGVPAILTSDLRSFWAQRQPLYDLGLQIWRPSDVLDAYETLWAAKAHLR